MAFLLIFGPVKNRQVDHLAVQIKFFRFKKILFVDLFATDFDLVQVLI